jgi:hypothetical protein
MRKNESAGFREIFVCFFLPLLVHIDWPPRTLTFFFFVFLLFLKLYFSHAHAAGYCVRVFFHFSRVIRLGGELPPVENGSIYNRLFIYIYIYIYICTNECVGTSRGLIRRLRMILLLADTHIHAHTRDPIKVPQGGFCEMDRNVVRTGRRRRKGDGVGGGLSRQ